MLQALNGFLMILDCQGELFFATHSIETYLGFHQVTRFILNFTISSRFIYNFTIFLEFSRTFSRSLSPHHHPNKPWPRSVSCGSRQTITIIALLTIASSHSCLRVFISNNPKWLNPGAGASGQIPQRGWISIHWARPLWLVDRSSSYLRRLSAPPVYSLTPRTPPWPPPISSLA